MNLDVEEIDLAALGDLLQRIFDGCPPKGFVRGRTTLRDAVADRLKCSEVEAEQLVETMIGYGLLRFEGEPTDASGNAAFWVISGSQ